MPSPIDTQTLRERIDQFERRYAKLSPRDAELELVHILTPLFEADGYTLDHTGGINDRGIDYIARKGNMPDQTALTTVIQYKHLSPTRHIPLSVVQELIGATILVGKCNRAILLTNAEFTNATQEALLHELPFEFQLMNLNSLRAWVHRIERVQERDISPVVQAVTDLSKQLARLVAVNSRRLDEIEWRDMERMLASILDALGFQVELTPPAQDGGKDLVVTCVASRDDKKYLIEVKHWRSRKGVGGGLVRQFIHVVANEQAEQGLFLATYGYANNALEAITEIERRKVSLGEENKIVSLCQTFVKAESGIWSPPQSLPELLFEGTE